MLPRSSTLSLRRGAVVLLSAVSLALALATANAQAAAVKLSGTVVCANGWKVVGIEVQVRGNPFLSRAESDWKPMPNEPNVAQFSRWVEAGSKIRLHVGCGNTPAHWWSDNWTPELLVSAGKVVNTVCRPTPGRGAVRCRLPSIGLTAPDRRNHFDAGWCTWGAAKLLHRATGKYPGWYGPYGNAKDWAKGARGWLVRSEPMAHSIFVYPGGLDSSPLGHVGWVDSVEYRAHATYLHTTEMNGWHGGLFRWSHERTKYRRSMRFILVP